ncbi:MAG: lytic transglycosylase domain-containing protein, partial [Firmicutes bacterium]|nr:lytic transglycosylase domain-containing protein [Bacillota bacterium]
MANIFRWLRPLLLTIFFVALIVALIRSPQFGKLSYPYRYRDIIEVNAKVYSVDPLLVAAVI